MRPLRHWLRFALVLLLLIPSLVHPQEGSQKVVHVGPIEFRDGGRPDQVAIVDDLTVAEGQTNHDVVAVMGDVTVDGTVDGDLVVVLGSVTLGPSAVVERPMKIFGGDLTASSTARHAGVEGPVVSLPGWLTIGIRDWVRQGVFLVRPLSHQPGLSWWVAGVSLLVFVMVILFFPGTVQACAISVEARPASSFLVGLLTILLIGPILFLLAVSVVGLILVPFLVCAGVMACLIGKVSVYQFAGERLGSLLGWAVFQNRLVSLVLGALLFFLLYMVPLLGFLAWGLTATMAIGVVTMVGARSLRSENPGKSDKRDTAPPIAVDPEILGARVPGGEEEAKLQLPRAGFWIRLTASVLDLILIGAIAMCFRIVDVPTGPVFLILWVVYHLWMWTWRGTTIGGIVMGLKVVQLTGIALRFNVALVRCLSAFFSGLVLGLGFFWAGWSRERQSWHDIIAGTVIVKCPRGTQLI